MKTTPRFIGRVNFAPMDPGRPELWMTEEPFAQVTSDGFVIVCRPWKRTDGASIPRFVQIIPKIGHPFEKGNKYWSLPHDHGYNNTAVVLKLSDISAVAPESVIQHCGRGVYVFDAFSFMQVRQPRSWFDSKMVEAMVLTQEPSWKRGVVWSGVRAGGWKPWREVRKAA